MMLGWDLQTVAEVISSVAIALLGEHQGAHVDEKLCDCLDGRRHGYSVGVHLAVAC